MLQPHAALTSTRVHARPTPDSRFRNLWRTSAGVALALALTSAPACNEVPLADLEQSFQGKVVAASGPSRAVKLDVLWVIDNSSSMGQEQVALAETFQTFIDGIFELDVDLRLAVTTTADTCDQGLFNATPAKDFALYADKQVRALCTVDEDCAGAVPGDSGPWLCVGQAGAEQNPDGSINSACFAACDSDDGCSTRFGENYQCNEWSRCGLIPQTDGCADTVGPILGGSEAVEQFGCIASVGLQAGGCFSKEMGLAAGLHALDSNGPRAAQAKQFLRDDAYLVVIFLSDEDDCSLREGATPLSGENESACAFDPAIAADLEPVHSLVNRYKSLKADPNSVIVAAIAGDATETGESQVLRRDAFLGAMTHHINGGKQPYICQSDIGTAVWGRRYQAFTEGFGARGVFTNICGDGDGGGIEGALERIAASIRVALGHVCLPRMPVSGEALQVYVEDAAGNRELLEEGADRDYSFLANAKDCPLEGLNALEFERELLAGEEFVIEYAFQLPPRDSP